jgi:hypothetical protein
VSKETLAAAIKVIKTELSPSDIDILKAQGALDAHLRVQYTTNFALTPVDQLPAHEWRVGTVLVRMGCVDIPVAIQVSQNGQVRADKGVYAGMTKATLKLDKDGNMVLDEKGKAVIEQEKRKAILPQFSDKVIGKAFIALVRCLPDYLTAEGTI